MSENKDNKLTLINEKTANDYLTHTFLERNLKSDFLSAILDSIKELMRIIIIVCISSFFVVLRVTDHNLPGACLKMCSGKV